MKTQNQKIYKDILPVQFMAKTYEKNINIYLDKQMYELIRDKSKQLSLSMSTLSKYVLRCWLENRVPTFDEFGVIA